MKILFLTSAAPKRAAFYTGEKRPPLGIGILISILKKAGHYVNFFDEYLKRSNVLDTTYIIDKKIDFVCIYSNTICYQSTLKMFKKLFAMRSRGQWNGKIIVGGPHTSYGAEKIPKYVDYIVIGEGEKVILDIISGKANERIIVGEKIEQNEMDLLPMPAWEEFVCKEYCWSFPDDNSLEEPCFTMNTSRGCPFDCTFCSVKGIWGKTYRYMSAERIVQDIQYLMKYYGARSFYFREDHFTLNKKRIEQFCKLINEKKIDIHWACETRVDQLGDYKYQKLMYDAGCRYFYIGVESGSQKMLDFYKKGETLEQFKKAFDIARKIGIKTYASFVVESPNETDGDRSATENFIKQIKPDSVGLNLYVGLPGSEIYSLMKEQRLYEFEDEQGVLYPIGYLKNIKKYYGNNSYFKVYNSRKKSLVNNTSFFGGIFDRVYNSSPKKILDSIKYRVRTISKYLKL